jgi:hypothetical protein
MTMKQKQFSGKQQQVPGRIVLVALAAVNCHALTMKVHLEGTVGAPPSSANDFHMRVTVTPPFAVGEPIDFKNGAFSTDGTTTSDAGGFTVNWSGALVTGGGPFTFGFDFTSNQPFALSEAWWTLNGARIGQQNLAPAFDATVTAGPGAAVGVAAVGGPGCRAAAIDGAQDDGVAPRAGIHQALMFLAACVGRVCA